MPIDNNLRTLQYISKGELTERLRIDSYSAVLEYERIARLIQSDMLNLVDPSHCNDCREWYELQLSGAFSVESLRDSIQRERTLVNLVREMTQPRWSVSDGIDLNYTYTINVMDAVNYGTATSNSVASSPLESYREKQSRLEKERLVKLREAEAKLDIRASKLKLTKRQAHQLKHYRGLNMEIATHWLDTIEGKKPRENIQDWLSDYRFRVRSRLTTDNVFDSIDQPNRILDMLRAKFDPKKPKSPGMTSIGQWVGAEIECFIPYSSLVERDYDDDGDEDSVSYNDADNALTKIMKARKIKNVQSKTDGSINPGDVDDDEKHFCVEFCALFTMQDRSNLKALCKMLKDLGARVNRSCGLHIHLDTRDLIDTTQAANPRRPYRDTSLRKAMTRAYRLKHALPLLAQMVPPSRRNNSYCKLDISQNQDRYYAINTTSLSKFGTIEIRMHSGTTEFSKISNWIDLLYALSRSPKLTRHEVFSVDQLKERLPELDETVAKYVKDRIKKFSKLPVVSQMQNRDNISFISIDDEDSEFSGEEDNDPLENELDESVSF